jgi:hypothetical protein
MVGATVPLDGSELKAEGIPAVLGMLVWTKIVKDLGASEGR